MGDLDYVARLNLVRRRPGMYFGDVEEGVKPLIFELVANAMDQYLLGQATRVDVEFSGDRVIVSDDGPGLPFDEDGEDPEDGEDTEDAKDTVSLATRFLTHLHSSATADSHAPHVHLLSSVGVGLAAVNAVSSSLVCTSWRGGYRWRQEFRRGVPEGPPEKIKDTSSRGTIIEVVPDPDIWPPMEHGHLAVRSGLFLAAHLVPGFRIGLNEERFHSPTGLAALVHILLPPTPEARRQPPMPFSLHTKVDDVELQLAVLGQAETTRWHTWVNGVPTRERGSDRVGLEKAFSRAGWTPAIVACHLVMHDPQYAGPTRDQLVIPTLSPLLQDVLRKPLSDYLKSSPFE